MYQTPLGVAAASAATIFNSQLRVLLTLRVLFTLQQLLSRYECWVGVGYNKIVLTRSDQTYMAVRRYVRKHFLFFPSSASGK